MSRTGQSEPLRLRPQAMSLDEARQVITCWLESIETVDPIDLTEKRFEAAISEHRLRYHRCVSSGAVFSVCAART